MGYHQAESTKASNEKWDEDELALLMALEDTDEQKREKHELRMMFNEDMLIFQKAEEKRRLDAIKLKLQRRDEFWEKQFVVHARTPSPKRRAPKKSRSQR